MYIFESPIYYYLRTEDKLPIVIICLLIDDHDNIGRGIALYKREKDWQFSRKFGRAMALRRATWALENRKSGRPAKTMENKKRHSYTGKTTLVKEIKETILLLSTEGLLGISDIELDFNFPSTFNKCQFNPKTTPKERHIINKTWKPKGRIKENEENKIF